MSVPGSQANPPYTEAVPPAVPTVTASAVPTGQPYYGAPGADNVQSAGGGYAQSAYVAQPVQSPALGEKTQGNPVGRFSGYLYAYLSVSLIIPCWQPHANLKVVTSYLLG